MLKNFDFSSNLIHWYEENKRDLPWRHTQNPYFILLSEIILQQTRVQQGLPYYYKFIHNFPTIFDLAKAEESEIYQLWQGLGYYSRAKNLHLCAKQLVSLYQGSFPENYNDLIKLSGIGPYTASAILAFAFNKNVVLIDGNVYRFISRLWSINELINTSKSLRIFNELLLHYLPKNQSNIFNQAIMEYGALICTPKQMKCGICVFQSQCISFKNNEIDQFPVKKKNIIKKNRYFTYFVFIENQQLIISKRVVKDIWQNLFEFPLSEEESLSDFEKSEFYRENKLKYSKEPNFVITNKKHILTHQNIFSRFVIYDFIPKEFKNNQKFKQIFINQIDDYPFPVMMNEIIQQIKIGLYL
ncbi:MAG: A/G-specific adenine glycosylase [Flavobacteriia bacterium]|nr:A/G-specific adenine glycosylase [Flavobacteriia bacterium]